MTRLLDITLLEFRRTRDRTNQENYEIVGGLLTSAESGHLEFLRVPAIGCILAMVKDFRPRLPWLIYQFTEPPLHLWVTPRFGEFLVRSSNGT